MVDEKVLMKKQATALDGLLGRFLPVDSAEILNFVFYI